jgi:hypothetical protein
MATNGTGFGGEKGINVLMYSLIARWLKLDGGVDRVHQLQPRSPICCGYRLVDGKV